MKRPEVEPAFRDLSTEECQKLLNRNHVGRLAFSSGRSVDIRPLHYVYSDGWLFGRTSPGDKLMALEHKQWVAFEIDEISGPLDWASVVTHGTFYLLSPEGSEHDVRLYERAVAAVRRLSPQALTERDPLPFRTSLFAIAIDSVSGRSSSTRVKK